MNTVINAALGQGYEKGQDRLWRSLERNYRVNFLGWKQWPPWEHSKSSPYVVKAAALQAAIQQGHQRILWLDASVVVSGSLDPIFEHMQTHGVYLPSSGWNCAQSCNDRILEYYGITRDQAEHISDGSSGCMGVDMGHPIGAEFARMFIQAAIDGQFEGSRLHDNQSQDPRFRFHRQDQSAASLIAHKLGITLTFLGDLAGYWGHPHSGKQVVHFKGIQ